MNRGRKQEPEYDALARQLVDLLARTPGGLTATQLSRRIRGVPKHEIQATLLNLQNAGRVDFRSNRWQGVGPVTQQWTPSSRLGSGVSAPNTSVGRRERRPSGANADRRQAAIPNKANQAIALRGTRWDDFRRLCRYYAECVRLEQGANVRSYAEYEGKNFVPLHGMYDWRAFSSGRPIALRVAAQARSFVKAVSSSRAFVGGPIDLFHWTDQKTKDTIRFVSPIFVVQVESELSGEMLHLTPVGPPQINHGWLEKRFRNHEDRRLFLELCGLERTEADDAPADDLAPGFPELFSAMHHYYADWWRELANLDRLVHDTPYQNLEDPGVYNRAAVFAQRKWKYTARLYKELLRLADDTSDEELDASALTHLFPQESAPQPENRSLPRETTDDSTENSPAANGDHTPNRVVAEFDVLNAEQLTACRYSQEAPLTVVTGPPGTGKSRVVSHVLASAAINGDSALFASRNHQALEAVVPRLNSITEPAWLVLRMSRPFNDPGEDPMLAMLGEFLAKPKPANVEGERQLAMEAVVSLAERLERLRDQIQKQHEASTQLRWSESQLAELLEQLPLPYEEIIRQTPALPRESEIRGSLAQLSPPMHRRFSWMWWKALFRKLFRKKRDLEQAFAVHEQFLRTFPDSAYRGMIDRERVEPKSLVSALEHWRAVATSVEVAELVRHDRTVLESWQPLAVRYERLQELQEELRSQTLAALRLLAESYGGTLAPEEKERLAEVWAGYQNYRGLQGTAKARNFDRALQKAFAILVKHSPLWATTNLSAGRDLPFVAGTIDLLIVDEASQCDIASTIPLLFRSRRAMIVGDPMQLPNITQLGKDVDLRLREQFSLTDIKFERFSHRVNSLFQLAATDSRLRHQIQLREHHRSHPAIAEYSNEAFYNKTLRIATRTDRLVAPAGKTADHGGFRWTHVQDDAQGSPGGGAISPGQIDAIVAELTRLRDANFMGTIGVVTPFRPQANRIRDRAMSAFGGEPPTHWNFHVDTADGFQGDERDVILLSLVGGKELPRGASWFLHNSPNRFNVAVSRAKALLHVFGDEEWCRACGIAHVTLLQKVCHDHASVEAPRVRTDLIGPVWEPRLADALRKAGIPFQQQYPACGRFLDFAVFRDEIKLDVEVDGETYHRDADGRRVLSDYERDMTLIADGWTIERFWVYELREDMDRCIERIRARLISEDAHDEEKESSYERL